MVLRHEDSINATLTESQFMIHFNLGEGTIIGDLLQESASWQQKTQKDIPLRHQLAKKMMDILASRLQKLAAATPTDQIMTDCAKYHIVNSQGTMPFLAWNAKTQQLEPTVDKPLTIQEVLKTLSNIQRLMVEKEVTVRFHSLRKLEGTPTRAVPWLWQVSTRHNPELWHEIRSLCFHSSWQLVMARIKPQTLQRSPLAQQISRRL